MSGPAAPARIVALVERPELANRTVDLLRTKSALLDLSDADARQIVRFMRVVNLPRGTLLFAEGESERTDDMLLVLSGDVSVDVTDGVSPVAVSVLGPGSLVGEMALLDGGPRSATCKALSDVTAAGLSRNGLQRLTEEHPQVAIRLLVAIAQRIGDRLRAMGETLLVYSRLNADQAAQIERLLQQRR